MKLVESPKSWLDPAAAMRAVSQEFARDQEKLREEAAALVRDRVQRFGRGPDGAVLAGYSTNTIWVSQQNGLKPKRRPRKSKRLKQLNNRNNWVGLYMGGYKEYREAVGLPTAGFYFSNFGTAWRHFGAIAPRPIQRVGSGFIWRVEIGFRRSQDAIAAAEAEEKRPRMFQWGRQEAQAFLDYVLFPKFSDAFQRFFT